MNKEEKKAILLSVCPPTEEQEKEFLAFITKKYGSGYTLEWKKEDLSGFMLQVGEDVYDRRTETRIQRLKDNLIRVKQEKGDVIPLLKKNLSSWIADTSPKERGVVLSVGDGIAQVSGLPGAFYGEILLFENNVKGMVQELDAQSVGCILFDSDDTVGEGSNVFRTGKMAGMPCGKGFLGRVVNALGEPIDGKGDIIEDGYRPVEHDAPTILQREPVNVPLETGILVIDSMFPIGRGQRELIIGDRQTGKTALAVDTVINQKGKNVICIYVAVGQKTSSVVRLAETLARYGAMEYTTVVAATASEAAPYQYIAPYAGCALAESFMQEGKDVLIVYDDLTKHAVAYRELSLLLGRSPGREAYPGDVFYLHSRLLERSAHLGKKWGGGSITALPIVETQAGDISSYIPTNIISITDGQIYLESDLFFAGQRPAVNVGLSVSRVGGDAQTKAMKKVAGTLRLDLAQYREIKVFSRFSADLDEMTKRQIAYGESLMQLMKQEKYKPYTVAEQVVLLLVATNRKLEKFPLSEVKEKGKAMLSFIQKHLPSTIEELEKGVWKEESRSAILSCADSFLKEEA